MPESVVCACPCAVDSDEGKGFKQKVILRIFCKDEAKIRILRDQQVFLIGVLLKMMQNQPIDWLTLISIVLGLILIYKQLRDNQISCDQNFESFKRSAYSKLYEQQNTIHLFFIDQKRA